MLRAHYCKLVMPTTTRKLAIASQSPIFKPLLEHFEMTRLGPIPYFTCTFIVLFALGCSKQQTEDEADAEERIVTAEISPVVNGEIQRRVTSSGVLFPVQQAAIV